MSCPTCGHTMASLPTLPYSTQFYCPRCGTRKYVDRFMAEDDNDRMLRVDTPRLILQLRDAMDALAIACGESKNWNGATNTFIKKFENIALDCGWSDFAEKQKNAGA